MRLRQIKISGFKSFADTTVIEFPGTVSGIVGPNGCGKSNVIDAVRWVLGEARVSELRGSSSMSELIFAGSTQRPASSRASVEMVLDNGDGSIAGPWGRFAELSVKRVVTRDGTNAYFLNNQQVRRRDVQDIFMGTGLGPRSYAIISQGMISNFIKAKPDELRVYLEEAAGVSKYKERRRETESALTRTRDNLERVALLQQTKAEELERLAVEAEVAGRWKALDDEKRRCELLWFYLQETEAARAVAALSALIAEKESRALSDQTQIQQLSLQADQWRLRVLETRQALEDARQAAWGINTRLTQTQGNIRHLMQRRESLQQQSKSLQERMERRRVEHDMAQTRREQLLSQKSALMEQAEQAREEMFGLEDEATEANACCTELKQSFETARRQANESERRIAVVNARIEQQLRESDQLQRRAEQLDRELAQMQAPDLEALDALREQIEETRAMLTELQEESAALVEESNEASALLQDVQGRHRDAEREAERLQARLQTLEMIQAKAAKEGALNEWLQSMGLDALRPLYEQIHVDESWATALESILSVRAAALPMGVIDRAAGFERLAPPGRLVFYHDQPASLEAGADSTLVPLERHVRADKPGIAVALHRWLYGVYVAEDLHEALSSRAVLQPHERIVTRQGHVVDRVSVQFWAEESIGAGVLSRSVEMEALGKKEQALRAAAQTLQAEVFDAQSRYRQLQERSAQASRNVQEQERLLHRLQLELSRIEAAVTAWKTRRSHLQSEMQDLAERREELAALQQESEDLFARLDEELAVAQQESMTRQLELERAESRVADVQSRVRELQSSVNVANMQSLNLSERVRDCQQSAQRALEDVELCREELESVAALLEEIDEGAEHEALARVTAELDKAKRDELQAQTTYDEAENRLEEVRLAHKALLDAQIPLQQETADLQVKRQAWVTQAQTFTQTLNESGGDRADLQAQVLEEGLKLPSVKAKVTRLAQQIEELGPVNHAALETLESARKAMQETERQVRDLQEAIDNLETTIRRIDAETRELLNTTFEAVNRNFSSMFTGLFGGGRAELKMTGDEILDSGVEVMAQPPGKRNDSVKLLSGGEQALTATALVFAIFKLNPAPFCLLDEVDAPLDEANQDRLARQIVSMSANTQFMMITHHRVTMEHMRQLVGVTMKEPGVSRVVSVDVDHATHLIGE
ncbi:MAG: chromosome segregation protein SMC [Duodenibacillus sp.]|nr:chromosome segregation protein SMC [Duodenibacillus sp.]